MENSKVNEKAISRSKILDINLIAIFTALTAVCSWISIPFTVPFTMQTFAIFTALLMLGGKRGTVSVMVYLAIGAVGLPVFAGFSGGIGSLLGTTGGYLIGFLAMALLYWLTVRETSPIWFKIAILVVGLFLCYAIGTAWFVIVYTSTQGTVGVWTALLWCVIPYIIPDLAKLALAVFITKSLESVKKEFSK